MRSRFGKGGVSGALGRFSRTRRRVRAPPGRAQAMTRDGRHAWPCSIHSTWGPHGYRSGHPWHRLRRDRRGRASTCVRHRNRRAAVRRSRGMYDTLQGVRVVEVSSWLFVPAAGAVLADWGADVIKIEHPVMGDPIRGLTNAEASGAIMNPNTELPNRGKRSVGLDITTDEGREILYQLVESADVFLTNFLPETRRRLAIDVEDIRGAQPADRLCPRHGSRVVGTGRRTWRFRSGQRLGARRARLPDDTHRRRAPESARFLRGPVGGDELGRRGGGGAVPAAVRRARAGGRGLALRHGNVVDGAGHHRGSRRRDERVPYPPQSVQCLGQLLPDQRRALGVPGVPAGRSLVARPVPPPRPTGSHRRPSVRGGEGQECPRGGMHTGARRDLQHPDVGRMARRPGHPRGRVGSGAQPGGHRCRIPRRSRTATCPTSTRATAGSTGASPPPCSSTRDPIGTLNGAPEHGQNTEEVLLELGLGWDDIVALKERGAVM